jgi:hypothetical protein
MRKCAICEKTSLMAGTRRLLRGHYNPTNWSRKYPNLQKTRTPEGKRILACIKCLRRLHGRTATRAAKKRITLEVQRAARKKTGTKKTVKATTKKTETKFVKKKTMKRIAAAKKSSKKKISKKGK